MNDDNVGVVKCQKNSTTPPRCHSDQVDPLVVCVVFLCAYDWNKYLHIYSLILRENHDVIHTPKFQWFPIKINEQQLITERLQYSSWHVYDIGEKVCLGTVHYLQAGGGGDANPYFCVCTFPLCLWLK